MVARMVARKFIGKAEILKADSMN